MVGYGWLVSEVVFWFKKKMREIISKSGGASFFENEVSILAALGWNVFFLKVEKMWKHYNQHFRGCLIFCNWVLGISIGSSKDCREQLQYPYYFFKPC